MIVPSPRQSLITIKPQDLAFAGGEILAHDEPTSGSIGKPSLHLGLARPRIRWWFDTQSEMLPGLERADPGSRGDQVGGRPANEQKAVHTLQCRQDAPCVSGYDVAIADR